MKPKQQEETLAFFRDHADAWKKKAARDKQGAVNVIHQRNDFVVKVAALRKETRLALDVGCGTGDLVCALAEKGIQAKGVDFAGEMIDFAKKNADKNHLDLASFECASIFDFHFEPKVKYDLVSANGLIEYISFKELNSLIKLLKQHMRPGASLVLGSRNRLFNIVSMNQFTTEEMALGSIKALLAEAICLVNAKTIKDVLQFQQTASLQKPGKVHPVTGIKVATRYQFTPVQLMRILCGHGFTPVEIAPVHIHGVPPRFQQLYPEIHTFISNALQGCSDNLMSLIPQSSSFMIHAKRK